MKSIGISKHFDVFEYAIYTQFYKITSAFAQTFVGA